MITFDKMIDPAAWAQKAAEWVKHKQSLSHGNDDMSGHYAYGNEMKFDDRHPPQFHNHDANFEQGRLPQHSMDNYNYNAMPGNERFYENEPHQYMQHAPIMQMGPDGVNPNQIPYPYPGEDIYPGAPNTLTNFDGGPNPEASFGYGCNQHVESVVPTGLQQDASNSSIPIGNIGIV